MSEEKVIIPEVLDDDEVTVFDKKDNLTGVHYKNDGKSYILYVPNDGKEDVEEKAKEQFSHSTEIATCSPTLQQMFATGRGESVEQELGEADFSKDKPWDVRMRELFAELDRLKLREAVREDRERRRIYWQPAKIQPAFRESITISQVHVESITIIKNGNTVFSVAQKMTVMQAAFAKSGQHDLFAEADVWAKKEYKLQKEKGRLTETYTCAVKYNATFAPNYKGYKETQTNFKLSPDISLAKEVEKDLTARKVKAEQEAEKTNQTVQAVKPFANQKKRRFSKIKGFEKPSLGKPAIDATREI